MLSGARRFFGMRALIGHQVSMLPTGEVPPALHRHGLWELILKLGLELFG